MLCFFFFFDFASYISIIPVKHSIHKSFIFAQLPDFDDQNVWLQRIQRNDNERKQQQQQ